MLKSSWNVNAKEFTPGGGAAVLRSDAPVFVPRLVETSDLVNQLREVVVSASIKGIKVKDIPDEYYARFNKNLELPSDLSNYIRANLPDVYLDESESEFKSVNDVMIAAGFKGSMLTDEEVDSSKLGIGNSTAVVEIGSESEKYARHVNYQNYLNDLISFKSSIINVVSNFCLKGNVDGKSAQSTGLALSLFAAEWDRYHNVRGIHLPELRILRERFGATKLMPFLQNIPELEVVGLHPEVRVRVKPGVSFNGPKSPVLSAAATSTMDQSSIRNPRSVYSRMSSPNVSQLSDYPLNNSRLGKSTISLNSELFGEEENSADAQTRTMLEQMMNQTQGQILSILSTVPSDPTEAAAAVEKVGELQVLVNALKAALAVLPEEKPSAPVKPTTLNLNSMLNLNDDPVMVEKSLPAAEPQSVLNAAAGAGAGVGQLLADLSKILLAQVTEPEVKNQNASTAALEKTLAEIVSAASTPPQSPIGNGNLIIPKSLPTSPIDPISHMLQPFSGSSTPQTLSLSSALGLSDDSTAAVTPNEISAMDQLLRGLANMNTTTATVVVQTNAPTVVGPNDKAGNNNKLSKCSKIMNSNKNIIGKRDLLSVMKQLREDERYAGPPDQLLGLSCRQAAPRVSRKNDVATSF